MQNIRLLMIHEFEHWIKRWQIMKYMFEQNRFKPFNSYPPNATYMHQSIRSALVQIMACRLFSTKLLNQCWIIVNWNLRNKPQWNFDQSTKFFIHKNASENIVYEVAAILSMGDELTPYTVASYNIISKASLITRFMGPTWGPYGADRTQVGPMLAP